MNSNRENATSRQGCENAPAEPLVWRYEYVKAFWDYWSKQPETYFTSHCGAKIVEIAVPYIEGRCKRVLDYGCGAGHLIGHLLRMGFSVSGCDLSPDSLALVNSEYGHFKNFEGAKLTGDLGVADKFDAVFLVEIVEHLEDDVLNDIFTRVSSLLKPEGIVVITTPNREDLAASTIYCPTCNHTFHRWQHVRAWSVESLRDYLNRGGYEVVAASETDFSYKVPVHPPERFYKRALRKVFGLPWHVQNPGRPHLFCIARRAI